MARTLMDLAMMATGTAHGVPSIRPWQYTLLAEPWRCGLSSHQPTAPGQSVTNVPNRACVSTRVCVKDPRRV
ncbi:hypothetical protein F5Y01DRAFT_299689 [Xylaria sp. FL0043]|nr:hypothetical protein F5Y01DRAFT_299689 [Xylaria sp. FL0043]